MITLALAVCACWAILLAAYAGRLGADWREPVLAAPVLIIESDDWGPGPAVDADRLQQIAGVLAEFRDARGGTPVMTLGVVLAVPAGAAAPGGLLGYQSQALDAPVFATIRDAMLTGCDAGVFALQLHGMEHFWPAALVSAAAQDDAVRGFLSSRGGAVRHESLPSHLQARWIDASRLPTAPLPGPAIERAAAKETACFARVFGAPARVAVPVTFTWTETVEQAWASGGVRVVVTPGTRYVGRDGEGRLLGDGSLMRNGDRGAGGVTFVVRDVHFEPALGHTAGRTVREILERHRLGRPALLEMHRFNFTGDEDQAARSSSELRRLLADALAATPGLRFLSTEALGNALAAGDPALVDRRPAARVRALVLRAATAPRLRRLAWVSGLALPAVLAYAIATALLRRPVETGA